MIEIPTSFTTTSDIQKKSDKIYALPFCEADILQLQLLCTTPGIHTIQVFNIEQGKAIIKTILNSLKCYFHVGYISYEQDIPSNYYNVIADIEFQKIEHGNFLQDLENYLVEHSEIDFMVIAWTKELQDQCTKKELEKILKTFHIFEEKTILFVEYQE